MNSKTPQPHDDTYPAAASDACQHIQQAKVCMRHALEHADKFRALMDKTIEHMNNLGEYNTHAVTAMRDRAIAIRQIHNSMELGDFLIRTEPALLEAYQRLP